SLTDDVADGASRSWELTLYPRPASTCPTLSAVVWIVLVLPSTVRWTVLSTEFQAMGAAMRPASTAPLRPYLTLRSTERSSSVFPGGRSLRIGHGTVTDHVGGGTP